MPDDPRPRPLLPDVPRHDEAAAHARDERLFARMMREPPPARRAAPRADGRTPVRLVLDTNVSLDLFVFRDPRWSGLLGMLADGTCEALMDAACRDEFARVLGYAQFGLDSVGRVRALQAFDALHRIASPGECLAEPVEWLPQCRDGDDQKFMELACRVRADALLSKDKALLKLARRNRRAGLFEILSPRAWLERREACVPET